MNIMGIVLPVAAVLIAGLLIAALWLWWGGGASQEQTATDSNPILPSPTTAPDENTNEDVKPGSGFHVLASPQSGKVMIRVGEKTYAHITEVPSAALQDQIRLQIQALQQFVSEVQEYKSLPTISSAPASQVLPEKQIILPSNTMADQIEAILQERLLTLPHMHDRMIHILNSSDGGVQIKVDDTYYDSVNDVQDNEIKSILQTAIQEWEMRDHLS